MICCLALCASSCVPVIFGAGVAASGKLLTQQKTIGESLSDTTIWSKIRAAFASSDIEPLIVGVHVEVHEGRVLLTGYIEKQEDAVKILKAVWSQNGVKEVINEMHVKPGAERSGIATDARDSWITAKIKSKMLKSHDISSANYTIETLEGVVYVLGTANSSNELAVVKTLISQTEGVKNTVYYVRIIEDIDSKVDSTVSSSKQGTQKKDVAAKVTLSGDQEKEILNENTIFEKE